MKKRIFYSFIIIFMVLGIGTAAVVKNLLDSTSSLRDIVNLHEIEDIRQNLNLRVQTIQAYVHLPAIDFSYNLDEVAKNINGLETAVQNCHGCHHEPDVKNDITYTEHLIQDFQEKLSYLITSRSDVEWRKTNQRQALKISDAILHHVQEMVNRAAATLQRKTDIAMKGISKTYFFLVMTFLATVIIGYALAHYLTKRVSLPIDELLIATKKIADGELGYEAKCHGSQEFVELLKTFNSMSAALAEKKSEAIQLQKDLENKIDQLHNTQDELITIGKLASLGRLAGGLAHDFNNILCGILGHVGLLKTHFKEDQAPYQTLSTIENASHQAAALVEKLQTFAQLKNWQKEPVDINQVIIAVGHSLTHGADTQKHITLHLENDLPLIQGDRKHLQELIANICDNALAAIPPQGKVTLSTINLEVCQNHPFNNLPDGRYVHIDITDNGKGIDENVLPHVYDPYFSTEEFGVKKGIGLGMAIAFSIVSNHDGRINIKSTQGIGTTVSVYLPVQS